MLIAFLLESVVLSFNIPASHISEMVDGANEYLGDAGSFQLKIAANDPCVLKLNEELSESCALSTDDKSRLALQWMNCMRESTGRHTVPENVADLEDNVYSTEFILYLHRVETLCFWIDQRRQDIFDAWWKDRQYQLMLGLQQTTMAVLGVGEKTVERLLSPSAIVKFPSGRLLSHVGISLTERQWKKFGVASAIVFFVFPFLAPRTGYFKGIQFAPLLLIFGIVFELLAFFMDVNYSSDGDDEDLESARQFVFRLLQPGDLLIASVCMSYVCMFIGVFIHYRRTRMSDVYSKVQHINNKMDDRVFKLCEVFNQLNLSDEDQYCKLCGKRTGPYNLSLPVAPPISLSINPESSRRNSIICSKLNGCIKAGAQSVDSCKPDKLKVQNPHFRRQMNTNGHLLTDFTQQESNENGMFTETVVSSIVIMFFFFPTYTVWIIRVALDKITIIYM